jgi:hypothetical protein
MEIPWENGVPKLALSIESFNQFFTLKIANEIWSKLHELHYAQAIFVSKNIA